MRCGAFYFWLTLRIIFDQGTRDDVWMRSARGWSLFKSRMNLKLVRSVKLNPQQQYIIGLHPHGILPWGACVNMVTTQSNAQYVTCQLVQIVGNCGRLFKAVAAVAQGNAEWGRYPLLGRQLRVLHSSLPVCRMLAWLILGLRSDR